VTTGITTYAARMTRPSNVIYLPPGVVPPPPTVPAPVGTPGVPFDRQFFQEILGGAVKSFCEQAECSSPIVELFTIDGARHFIKGISGVSDSWVALHTQAEDHDHPIQVFLPFTTIYRVEIHAENDTKQRRLGFISPAPEPPVVITTEGVEVKPATKPPAARRSRKTT
jgi:hypothetical protein